MSRKKLTAGLPDNCHEFSTLVSLLAETCPRDQVTSCRAGKVRHLLTVCLTKAQITIETTLMFQPNPLNTHNPRNPSQVHFKTCVIPMVDRNRSVDPLLILVISAINPINLLSQACLYPAFLLLVSQSQLSRMKSRTFDNLERARPNLNTRNMNHMFGISES